MYSAGSFSQGLNIFYLFDPVLQALFSRHPEMPDWPVDHGWYFAKLDISSVILLDYFGGAVDVDLQEYYNTQP